jgi:hypothetical protein
LKKTWEEAVNELEKFWTEERNGLSSTPNYSEWWWRDDEKKKKYLVLQKRLQENIIQQKST